MRDAKHAGDVVSEEGRDDDMQTFRAYLLNPAGRIMSAVEVEADHVAEAKMRAGGHPHDIEI